MNAVLALLLALLPAPALADEGPGERRALTCCATSELNLVLREYLQLQALLASRHDDGNWVSGRMYALHGAVNALTRARLPPPEREVARRLLADVGAVRNARASGVRGRFDAISRKMAHLVLNDLGGQREVAEAFCPGVGVWLQEGDELRNPYGAERCGRWR